MKWYIYDESGRLEAPVRVKYNLTKDKMAHLIAEKTNTEGKKKVIEDDVDEKTDFENTKINVSSTNWTKKGVDDQIRKQIEIAGESASRYYDPDSQRREKRLEEARKIVDKYYDGWTTFQIQFDLSPREVALLISDEIDDKEKITKKYVDNKVRDELKVGGIHQAWHSIGDYVDKSTVEKAEKKITELYDLDEFRKHYDFEPKFKSKGRGKGWWNDPSAHALASKGLKTRWKSE